MKKSELRKIIREMISGANKNKEIGQLSSKSSDPIIDKIGDIAKTTTLMNMRKPLEKLFKMKDIDFALSPIAHFRIKHKGKMLIIVNKKYADDAELTVGNLSIGYEGKV